MKRFGSVAFVAIMLLMMAVPAPGLLSGGERVQDALITLHADISEALFRQSGEEQVVIGREGWLFFDEEMPDYYRRGGLTDMEIESIADRLARLSDDLAAEGIGFTFLCAPNKSSVYPEYLPYYAASAGEAGNRSRLHAALDTRGVAYIDAAALLREGDAPLYYRTDTHWNSRGALLVYRALMARIAPDGEVYADIAWTEGTIAGDLVALYRPLGGEAERTDLPDIARAYRAVGTIRSLDDMTIRTHGDEGGPRLLVYRDSFGEQLFPYLANATEHLVYARALPQDAALAVAEGVRHVVLEIAERNLGTL